MFLYRCTPDFSCMCLCGFCQPDGRGSARWLARAGYHITPTVSHGTPVLLDLVGRARLAALVMRPERVLPDGAGLVREVVHVHLVCHLFQRRQRINLRQLQQNKTFNFYASTLEFSNYHQPGETIISLAHVKISTS